MKSASISCGFGKGCRHRQSLFAVNAVCLRLLHTNHGCKGYFLTHSVVRGIYHLKQCFNETSENKEEAIESNFVTIYRKLQIVSFLPRETTLICRQRPS